ncbi:MAG: YbhB/YbcL family Raf kinase inhibitor-like protein [Candidatus Pacearchaeota archaeon]
MKLTSKVFENNGRIPVKYTCDGENINPPIEISDVPKSAVSLVLIMDDPDAIKPAGKVWDHWVIWNIPPDTKIINENSIPKDAIQGVNSRNMNSYTGPCPPDKEHRYFFKLYALSKILNLPKNSTKKDVEKAMKNHIIDRAELIGKYKRK